MKVRILQLGRKVIDYDAPAGSTLAAALEATSVPAAQGMDLRINSQPATLDDPLKEGDVVTVIPRIKGGAILQPGMVTKALFTSEDLERIQAATGRNYELVRGELYELMPPSARHGMVAVEIASLLRDWNRRTHAGVVMVESGFTLQREPDTVRGPDVSFVSKGRITREQARNGFPNVAPDFAAEVRSPNDTWQYLREKAQDYLAAGTRMVLIVEPDEYVEVLRPGQDPQRLGLEDELDGADVLPGFRCRVADLFPPEV